MRACVLCCAVQTVSGVKWSETERDCERERAISQAAHREYVQKRQRIDFDGDKQECMYIVRTCHEIHNKRDSRTFLMSS